MLAVLLLCLGSGAQTSKAVNSPRTPPVSEKATPVSGSLQDGVYRNPFFGFSYQIPYGWVERTQAMQEGTPADSSKALVLLAVFERPPEAAADTPNTVVVIVGESISSYPGLKSAADYFGPLTEVTTARGFKVVNQPYEFSVGTRPLVRGDFSKELKTLTMYQSSLVMLAKSYVVSFTFIAGGQDDISALLEGLSFGLSHKPPAAAAPAKK
jgi:hypothetical protein